MEYVIKNLDNGKYVAKPDSYHSYTSKLQDARVFTSEEEAKRNKCDNETVIPR